ncbi:unnamed protein product [Brassica oleracea var. botrytis]
MARDNGVPDLGGMNNEETFFADEIHHLAVNALLKSNLVSEMEGALTRSFMIQLFISCSTR